jgi:hypothetical protein
MTQEHISKRNCVAVQQVITPNEIRGKKTRTCPLNSVGVQQVSTPLIPRQRGRVEPLRSSGLASYEFLYPEFHSGLLLIELLRSSRWIKGESGRILPRWRGTKGVEKIQTINTLKTNNL